MRVQGVTFVNKGVHQPHTKGNGDPPKPLAAAAERLRGQCKQQCKRAKKSMVTQSNNRPAPVLDSGQVRLLTIPQVAAEYLQVSVRKVWGLIERGELPVVRIGRCTRVTLADLKVYVSSARQGYVE